MSIYTEYIETEDAVEHANRRRIETTNNNVINFHILYKRKMIEKKQPFSSFFLYSFTEQFDFNAFVLFNFQISNQNDFKQQ